MNTPGNRIQFCPISEIARLAASDLREDYSAVEARFKMAAVRGFERLANQYLYSGVQKSIITVNEHTNTAILPCGFKRELFVGIIDDCGRKVSLMPDGSIPDISNIAEVPCENGCDVKCATSCYDKGMCNDLQTTRTEEVVTINAQQYTNTITYTLMPDGSLRVVKRTWFLDTADNIVKEIPSIKFEKKLDVAECGCVKKTEQNSAILQQCCYDVWCCYCSTSLRGPGGIGYNIFPETGVIQFAHGMPYKKIYIEYIGSLPKSGNEYLVPEKTKDTLVAFVKWRTCKPNTLKWQKDDYWNEYLMERENMKKIDIQFSLSEIMDALSRYPASRMDYDNSAYWLTISNSFQNA